MVEELQAIKDQLFDAPKEVKEAYNKIIMHFDIRYFNNEKGFTIKRLGKVPEKFSHKYAWVNVNQISYKIDWKVGDEVTYEGHKFKVIAKESYSEFEKKRKSGEYENIE